MKTPIAIIISGIVIAISIVVSTKMYVDANNYTFVPFSNDIVALSKDGDWYYLKAAGKDSLVWKKSVGVTNQLP